MSTVRSHMTGLDGLRGMAALSVLAFHVSNILSPEEHKKAPVLIFCLHQGLNLFFVLSGFLIYRAFAGWLADGRARPNIARYATNRILRLWPAYLVVLSASNFVLGVSFLGHGRTGRLTVGAFLADVTLLQTYNPSTLRSGLEVAWTLTVEVTFYALIPFLAVLARHLGRKGPAYHKALIPIALLAGIGGLGLVWQVMKQPHGWSHDWESVASRSLLVHGQLFALGMAATVIQMALRSKDLSRHRTRFVRIVFVLFAVVATAAAVSLRHNAPIADTAAAAAFAAVILIAVVPTVAHTPGLLARFLELPPIRYLGIVSFGIYLWHMPVVRCIERWAPSFGSGGGWAYAGAVGVVGIVTVALASLTYVFVESPCMRVRANFRSDSARQLNLSYGREAHP